MGRKKNTIAKEYRIYIDFLNLPEPYNDNEFKYYIEEINATFTFKIYTDENGILIIEISTSNTKEYTISNMVLYITTQHYDDIMMVPDTSEDSSNSNSLKIYIYKIKTFLQPFEIINNRYEFYNTYVPWNPFDNLQNKLSTIFYLDLTCRIQKPVNEEQELKQLYNIPKTYTIITKDSKNLEVNSSVWIKNSKFITRAIYFTPTRTSIDLSDTTYEILNIVNNYLTYGVPIRITHKTANIIIFADKYMFDKLFKNLMQLLFDNISYIALSKKNKKICKCLDIINPSIAYQFRVKYYLESIRESCWITKLIITKEFKERFKL